MQHLTRHELQRLLTAARQHSERNWLMLLVAYWHGLRATEVVSLRAEDVEHGHITVQRLKGSAKTVQPLVNHPDALFNEAEGLRKRIAEVGTGRLFPITRNMAWRIMRKYGIAAGIPKKKLHPHVLKHSRAMHTIPESGVESVRDFLGHKGVSSIRQYVRTDDQGTTLWLQPGTPRNRSLTCPKHPDAGYYEDGYQRRCKECTREHRRKYYARRGETLRAKYSGFIRQARSRGIPVTLSFEEWQRLKASPCAYRIEDSACPVGIDRKDNKKGYTPENCIPSCSLHNRIKGDAFTFEQMLEIANKYRIACGNIHTGQNRKNTSEEEQSVAVTNDKKVQLELLQFP